MRGSYQHGQRYPASDGAMPYCSSPSDSSLVQPWTPPLVQGIETDEFQTSAKRDTLSESFSFTPIMEGASIIQDGGGSTSSQSDVSDSEHISKLHLSTRRNFPNRQSFMSKPIHPVSFPHQIHSGESSESAGVGCSGYPHSEMHWLSSGSNSMDLTDISERLESDNLGWAYNQAEGCKCGLCDRFLSQRSPWSSRRIITSGDLPVTAVLSCRHVFHADCLEQTSLKARKSDPPCPICSKSEKSSLEEHIISMPQHGYPRPKMSHEAAGPSRTGTWGCAQAGDCVEGAVHGPPRSSLLLLGRNRIKKSLSLKGNASKEFPGKMRKIGSHPLQLLGAKFVDHALGSCSKAAAGSNMNKQRLYE